MPDSKLAFPPGHQFLDGNGDPLANGNVYIYDAGTTDDQTNYSDAALTSANAQPLPLDASGRLQSQVYIGTSSWKYVLEDSAAATIHTEDNIQAAHDHSSYLTGTVSPSRAVISKTTNYTTVAGDDGKQINCDATGGSFTLTLRSAVSVGDGGDYCIKHSGTANQVTVATTSAQGLDEGTTFILNPGDSIVPRSDGADWHIVEAFDFGAGVVTVAFADPLVIDFETYPGGTNFQTTLTADTTVSDPSNQRVGMNFTLTFIQDGTGGWTPTFNSAFKGKFAVNEVASAVTIMDGHIRAASTIDLRTRGGLITYTEYDLGVVASDGTTETQAHGLSRYPLSVACFLECTTAEGPFSIGDRIQVMGGTEHQRSDGSVTGIQVFFDTTNVYVQHSNSTYYALSAAGALQALTDANWKTIIRVFDAEPFA